MTRTQLRTLETIAAQRQRAGEITLAEYAAILEDIALLRRNATP